MIERIDPEAVSFKPTGFHTCLERLNEAENAWFDDEGNDKYLEWVHEYTALVRGMLMEICQEIDAARIKAAVENMGAFRNV